MTALTLPLFWRGPEARSDAQTRTDPPKPRRPEPLFIHDAVTPWRGETLLSARLKADIEAALQEHDHD